MESPKVLQAATPLILAAAIATPACSLQENADSSEAQPIESIGPIDQVKQLGKRLTDEMARTAARIADCSVSESSVYRPDEGYQIDCDDESTPHYILANGTVDGRLLTFRVGRADGSESGITYRENGSGDDWLSLFSPETNSTCFDSRQGTGAWCLSPVAGGSPVDLPGAQFFSVFNTDAFVELHREMMESAARRLDQTSQ